jgi:hypothetical protein
MLAVGHRARLVKIAHCWPPWKLPPTGEKSPYRSLRGSERERLIGTVRRECLDFMIPLHERQLRGTLRSWVAHYNKGRPHSSLGPGTPEPPTTQHLSQLHPRHRLPRDCRITVEDILGGLHHEYQLEKCVA